MRRYYEEIVSEGKTDAAADYVSEDYTEVHENQRYRLGVAGAQDHIRGVRSTYPDLRLTVDQQISEGEWVVTRLTMRGTHLGEWMGIKPTGRSICVTAVNIDRVVENRIVEHGGAANLLTAMLEIGAVKFSTE